MPEMLPSIVSIFTMTLLRCLFVSLPLSALTPSPILQFLQTDVQGLPRLSNVYQITLVTNSRDNPQSSQIIQMPKVPESCP